MYRDEILAEAELPIRLMAATPCYRREAGSAGRDTRGMLRSHEFDKVEILAIATPEQAPGTARRDGRRGPRRTIAALGLPWRTIEICAGDLGQSHHRSFDIEVYAPGVGAWLEVSSVSWFSDYQARRANIRFRRAPVDGKPQKGTEIAHTLNGSALAVPRVWAAIVENYRQADGSVAVPEALQPVHARHRADRCDDRTRWPASTTTCCSPAACSTRRLASTSPTSPPTRSGSGSGGTRTPARPACVEPNAMVLATTVADGQPDARYVLVRGVDERGFVFHTNYDSPKSRQLGGPPVRAPACSRGSACTARCGSAGRWRG